MSIELRNISKTFGAFTALRNVSLTIPDGELVALLGPSGSGKTTLLRIIAGLEVPDPSPDSAILFHDQDVGRQRVGERRVGFVFQHYALFRHMTVFENIAFGLRVRPRRLRPSREEIRARVRELLRLIQLEGLEQRYPAQLSGGQRQRVALARALAIEPKVLLLDEPFGALDAKVRQGLRRWLRRLHDEIHLTSVFVTHDQEEALEVADTVVIMNEAKIEQVGTPEDVFNHPVNAFVFNFLGNVNVFHGRVQGGLVSIGETVLDWGNLGHADAETVRFYLRPHMLRIERAPRAQKSFRARVERVNAAGSVVRVELVSEWGTPVQAEITQERHRQLGLKRGDEVFVSPMDSEVFVEDYVI